MISQGHLKKSCAKASGIRNNFRLAPTSRSKAPRQSIFLRLVGLLELLITYGM